MLSNPKIKSDQKSSKINNRTDTKYQINNILSYKLYSLQNVLQMNVLTELHSVLDQEAHMAIYRNVIISNCNYRPVVWDFCGIQCSQIFNKIIKDIKIGL